MSYTHGRTDKEQINILQQHFLVFRDMALCLLGLL